MLGKRGARTPEARAAAWRQDAPAGRELVAGRSLDGARDATPEELAEAMGLPPPVKRGRPDCGEDDEDCGGGDALEEADEEAPDGAAPLTLEAKVERLLTESQGSLVANRAWHEDSTRLRSLREPDGSLRRCPHPSFLHAVYWIKLANSDGSRPACLDVLRVAGRAGSTMRGAAPTAYDAVYTHPSKPGWWGVPRAWGLSRFGLPQKDARVLGEPMQAGLGLAPGRALRPDQVIAVARLGATLRDWGLVFLEADCGFGECYASRPRARCAARLSARARR
jgi:hypothetical protein